MNTVKATAYENRALTAYGRGYRLVLTLDENELAYVHVPESDDSAFAQGFRSGLHCRQKIGGNKVASAIAHQLLNQERINLRPVAE